MQYSTKKRKRRGRRNAESVLLFVLLLCTLTGAVYLGKMGFDEIGERRAGVSFYTQLAEAGALSSAMPFPAQASPDSHHASDQVQNADTQTGSRAVPELYIDFDALQNICQDIAGWIKIDGTVIDYPIVQGDDNDYYLNHLADGTPNSAGSIMMHYTNDRTFSDDVTVLHGHYMRNGTMFSNLEKYKKEAFYREHPTIRLFTPAGNYNAVIFAAYTVNAYSFDYVTSFADEAEFDAFIRQAVSSTGYETGVEVEFGERMLLLSTCEQSFDGARFVVIGKILEVSE